MDKPYLIDNSKDTWVLLDIRDHPKTTEPFNLSRCINVYESSLNELKLVYAKDWSIVVMNTEKNRKTLQDALGLDLSNL